MTHRWVGSQRRVAPLTCLGGVMCVFTQANQSLKSTECAAGKCSRINGKCSIDPAKRLVEGSSIHLSLEQNSTKKTTINLRKMQLSPCCMKCVLHA